MHFAQGDARDTREKEGPKTASVENGEAKTAQDAFPTAVPTDVASDGARKRDRPARFDADEPPVKKECGSSDHAPKKHPNVSTIYDTLCYHPAIAPIVAKSITSLEKAYAKLQESQNREKECAQTVAKMGNKMRGAIIKMQQEQKQFDDACVGVYRRIPTMFKSELEIQAKATVCPTYLIAPVGALDLCARSLAAAVSAYSSIILRNLSNRSLRKNDADEKINLQPEYDLSESIYGGEASCTPLSVAREKLEILYSVVECYPFTKSQLLHIIDAVHAYGSIDLFACIEESGGDKKDTSTYLNQVVNTWPVMALVQRQDTQVHGPSTFATARKILLFPNEVGFCPHDVPAAGNGERSETTAALSKSTSDGHSTAHITSQITRSKEVMNSIAFFMENKGVYFCPKGRRVERSESRSFIYGCTTQDIVDFLKSEHQISISRPTAHRLMEPRVKNNLNAQRHSGSIPARPSRRIKDEMLPHIRQHFAAAMVKQSIEWAIHQQSTNKGNLRVIQLNTDDLRALPCLVDSVSQAPGGFFLPNTAPIQYDHSFVLRKKLLIRTSGYVLAEAGDDICGKYYTDDKTGRTYVRTAQPSKMYAFTRPYHAGSGGYQRYLDLLTILQEKCTADGPHTLLVLVSDNGHGFAPKDETLRYYLLRLLKNVEKLIGIVHRSYGPLASAQNKRVEGEWSKFTAALAGHRLGTSCESLLGDAKKRNREDRRVAEDKAAEAILRRSCEEAAEIFRNIKVGGRPVDASSRYDDAPQEDDPHSFVMLTKGHNAVLSSPFYDEWKSLRKHIRSVRPQGSYYGPCGDQECVQCDGAPNQFRSGAIASGPFQPIPMDELWKEEWEQECANQRNDLLEQKGIHKNKERATPTAPTASTAPTVPTAPEPPTDVQNRGAIAVPQPKALDPLIMMLAPDLEASDQLPAEQDTCVAKFKNDVYTLTTTPKEFDHYMNYMETMQYLGGQGAVQKDFVVQPTTREKCRLCTQCLPKVVVTMTRADELRHARLFHTKKRKNEKLDDDAHADDDVAQALEWVGPEEYTQQDE
eukprot:GEMP01004044.1.p1 GENE.GEMP01004044.1~~GEMP01004044.1.p1  ORF type:complete len:1040 (-),score=136.62 GEMP01004044.1:216-3335(-)